MRAKLVCIFVFMNKTLIIKKRGGRIRHLLSDSIALRIHQALQTHGQLPAETVHIMVGVDVLADAFDPRPELSDCFRPWRSG